MTRQLGMQRGGGPKIPPRVPCLDCGHGHGNKLGNKVCAACPCPRKRVA